MKKRSGQLLFVSMITTTLTTFVLPVLASGHHMTPIAEPYEPGNSEVVESWQFKPGEPYQLAYERTQSRQLRHHHCRHKDAGAQSCASGYKL